MAPQQAELAIADTLVRDGFGPAWVSAFGSGQLRTGGEGTVTNLELALIPALSALGGVALGIGRNAWLDRIRDRRAVRRQRDRAIAELLAPRTI
jgi:4-hydroxybenzoate polyprenyltransferase